MADDTSMKESILMVAKWVIIGILIIVWILSGISLGIKGRVEEAVHESDADFEFTPQNLADFNPEVLFCGPGSLSENAEDSVSGISLGSIQANFNLGAITDTTPTPPPTPSTRTCSDGKVLNRCSDYHISTLFSLIGMGSDSIDSSDSKSDFCPGNKVYDDDETWCDSTHVQNDGTPINMRNKLFRKCCKKPPGDDSLFDVTKIILYLVISIPLVLIAVYKILKQTYIKTEGVRDTAKEKLGFVYLANKLSHYSKYIYISLFIVFIIIPIGKWFMIAISCPSEEPEFDSGKCGQPCSQESDCLTLHGNCGYCVTDSQNVSTCQNPSFVDSFGSSFELADLDLGICQEDLEGSKLLPGQVIHINDTINPFTVTIPQNPDLKPEFNNFVNLEPTTIENPRCPNGIVTIPGLQGPLSEQDLDVEDEPHNKVYINGTVEGTNSNPCNEIVIPSEARSLIEGAIQANIADPTADPTISNLGDIEFHNAWSLEFEVNRVACAEQNGRCYMKNYPCSLNNDVPIPLKHLEGGLPDLTLGELSEQGCKRAAYPCQPEEAGSCATYDNETDCNNDDNCIYDTDTDNGRCVRACTTLEQDNNNLIEGKGICRPVRWQSNWISDDSDTPEFRCMSESNWSDGSMSGKSIPGASYNDDFYGTSGSESQCTHTPRFPQIDTTEDSSTTYVIWQTTLSENSGYTMCDEDPSQAHSSNWTGECPTGQPLLSGNAYLDRADTTLEQIQASCCGDS